MGEPYNDTKILNFLQVFYNYFTLFFAKRWVK